MEEVAAALYQGEKRLQWDKAILTLRREEKEQNAWLCYQHNKAPMGLQSRDFVDKYCIFAIENKVYVLFSAMPNNLEEHPLPVGFLDQTSAQTRQATAYRAASGVNSSTPSNTPLVLHMLVGEITTGDSPLICRVYYRVIPTVLA